jgi:hypothetical protein
VQIVWVSMESLSFITSYQKGHPSHLLLFSLSCRCCNVSSQALQCPLNLFLFERTCSQQKTADLNPQHCLCSCGAWVKRQNELLQNTGLILPGASMTGTWHDTGPLCLSLGWEKNKYTGYLYTLETGERTSGHWGHLQSGRKWSNIICDSRRVHDRVSRKKSHSE